MIMMRGRILLSTTTKYKLKCTIIKTIIVTELLKCSSIMPVLNCLYIDTLVSYLQVKYWAEASVWSHFGSVVSMFAFQPGSPRFQHWTALFLNFKKVKSKYITLVLWKWDNGDLKSCLVPSWLLSQLVSKNSVVSHPVMSACSALHTLYSQ